MRRGKLTSVDLGVSWAKGGKGHGKGGATVAFRIGSPVRTFNPAGGKLTA